MVVACSVCHLYRCMLMVHYELCIMNYALSDFQVVTAAGSHLFPFRTEKLSPSSPMVLQCNAGE